MNTFQALDHEEVINNYHLFMRCINKLTKSTDPLIADKIKFLLKEQPTEDMPYTAVCIFNNTSIPLAKVEIPGSKKTSKKQPVKLTFEPYFYEKSAIIPTISEKMKVIGINHGFEKMLRSTIIECMTKVSKIDAELEVVREEFENFYSEKFAVPFVNTLVESLSKEIVNFEDIDMVDTDLVDDNPPA